MGVWDLRPHSSRVVRVNAGLLEKWQRLRGESGIPVEQSSLLQLINVHEQGAIDALTAYRPRLADHPARFSAGYHEKNAVERGVIRWEVALPSSLSEVILQGAHLGVASLFLKQPNQPFAGVKDWIKWDLGNLPTSAIPRTLYQRSCAQDTFLAAQEDWGTGRASAHYRLAWRRRIDPKAMERSLYAALIPPGPSHVSTVHTFALSSDQGTALASGFWSSIPLDYLLRVTGRADLRAVEANMMPLPESDHPLAQALLLRSLRLNCLTEAFAPLWRRTYLPAFAEQGWACSWPHVRPLNNIGPLWEQTTPFRTEHERRAALVEIDALVAVWLGISIEELIAVLGSRYPILSDRESQMWFDAAGHKIAADPYAFGYGQTKRQYEQLIAYLDDPRKSPVPEGYVVPFYKADRENEYRQAHSVFSKRLQDAIDAGWQPS